MPILAQLHQLPTFCQSCCIWNCYFPPEVLVDIMSFNLEIHQSVSLIDGGFYFNLTDFILLININYFYNFKFQSVLLQ